MTEVLQFWLVVEALGLLALPVCALLFVRLPGRGLALARPLGLLLASYPAWLLSSLDILRYGAAPIALGIALLGALGAVVWIRAGRPWMLQGTPFRLWLAGGILFAACFFGCALLRSFSPDIWNTEKPMDMAFIASIQRSGSFPPPDPWLSGHTLNYYYYGHYVVAFVARTAHLGTTTGFNLGVALFCALSAVTVFAVASALYLAARNGAGAPRRSPIAAGLAAVAFALVVGNLAGGVRYLKEPGTFLTYDWWKPSRVIEGTANEFPFFSFLLADLHAHVMAAPFALLVLAYSLQLCLSGPPRRGAAAIAELGLAALALGSLYATNSFDYPTALVLGTLAIVLWASPGRSRREGLGAFLWLGSWVAASLVLFLPFVLDFSPETKGVGLVRTHPTFSRFVLDEALIYGLPLWAVLTLYVSRLRVPFRFLAWGSTLAVFIGVLLAAHRLAGLVLALALAAFALNSALSPRFHQPQRFLWLLVAAAIGLIALGEFVYVRDSFDGTSSYRFNTVFKTGYQAWFLFAIAAGCIVFWNRAWLGRRTRAAWAVGLAALVLVSLGYPLAGSYARTGGFAASPTLNGLGWLERSAPGDGQAIVWLRTRVDGSPTVLEAAGPDFSPSGHARISTFTGLPTVVGWGGHEVQWGHDPGGRDRDVAQLYSTTDLAEARGLIRRYGISYVVVGSLERADYPQTGLAKFRRLGQPVFSARGTVVYRITPPRRVASTSSKSAS